MNYPCTKKIALRRLLTLTAALVLLSSLLAGCFGIGKDPDPTDDTGNLPNLVDESTTPSSDAASATTDPEIPENTAIVKEQVSVRSTPSNTAHILTQLDAGVQSEVLMLKTVHGIEWAYLTQGWVPCEALDMSHVTLTSSSTDTPASTDPTAADTPTETTKATEPNNSGSQTSTSGKSYGVVTTKELNIRSEASIDGTKVGSYSYGTRLTFTETSNGWGKTNKGWVSLKYVYMDGDNGSNGCSGVVTAAAGLNVRTGPGSNYDRVKTLAKGTKVTVKERIKINGTYWGYASGGWICMDYVDVDGETNNNNNTTTTTGNGTVTGNGLYIRSGAGTDYDTVGSLKKGDRVTIQETQTVDGVKWGRISQGWICLTYVKMD